MRGSEAFLKGYRKDRWVALCLPVLLVRLIFMGSIYVVARLLSLQIVNLIEETGHFNVTNTTFDFDLFSLDETTVRKLQSYLEAVAT